MIKLHQLSLLLLLALLNSNMPAMSQDSTIVRSVDKVIIEGKVYFVHNVKAGETVYSICKAYGISPKELSKDNPSVIMGLNTGMVLKIPESLAQEEESGRKDYRKYYYHIIETGETVYSISRLYNVEADDILGANPLLDINEIPPGTEILIPRMTFQQEKKGFVSYNEEYFYYKIMEGETFSSVARKFRISYRLIKKANREIFDMPLKPGDWIKIPRNRRTEKHFEGVVSDTLPVRELVDTLCVEETPLTFDNTVKLGLMLPFYLDENDEREYIDSSKFNDLGDRIYKTIRRDKNWIYPRSYRFVEFYEGVLLAAKDLNSRGLNVELYCFDTGQKPEKVKEVIEMGFLDDLDLLIGPVYSMNINVFNSYLDKLNIPVVSPFVYSDSLLAKNPMLFQVKPSESVENEIVSQLVSRWESNNIILVHGTDLVETAWLDRFKQSLLDSLSQYRMMEDIVLKEVVFTESRQRHDTINEIGDALLRDMKNVVIVLSKKETFVSASLAKLNELAKEYDVEIIGFPEWQKFRNIELDYFHDMGIYICSSYYLDYGRDDVKDFLKKYRNEFNTEPVPFSFAWTGYDIAYYFLSGLATYKDNFMNCFGNHMPDLLVSDFHFEKLMPGYGIRNTKLFLLQYGSNYSLRPYKLPEPPARLELWE